jgi:hypothetical protein
MDKRQGKVAATNGGTRGIELFADGGGAQV